MSTLRTAYRLVVEGWGVEAVTDAGMEKVTTDDVTRNVGLLRDGLSIGEQVDIARGEAEGESFTATIVDQLGTDLWTLHLAHQPQVRTWLLADINATSDPVNITTDASPGDVGDYIHIGTECLKITATVIGEPGAPPVRTCSRAHRGTIKQAHYTEDGENLTRPVVTHTYPMSLEGRRARLYEYRLDEHALDGDGEIIWRGVLSTDAALDESGCQWSFQVDSLYRLLDQDLGGDTEEEFSLRGYYYSSARPLQFIFYTRPLTGGPWAYQTIIRVTGHLQTPDELAAEINASSAAGFDALFASAAVSSTLRATPLPGGGVGFAFRTDGTETDELRILVEGDGNRGRAFGELLTQEGRDADYDGASTGSYTFEFAESLIAPRGVWGPHTGQDVLFDVDNQPEIIYPDGLQLLNLGDTVTLQDDGDSAQVWEVTLNDDTSRRYGLTGPIRDSPHFTPATAPRFKKFTTYERRGNLSDFHDALIAASPVDANRGAAPFVTSEDVGTAGAWIANVTRGAAVAGPLATRRYVIAQAVNLAELIAAECRILGTFPRLQSDAKIGMGYLELPSTATPSIFALDDSTILVDEQPPSWERNAIFGSINTVELLTGYDPGEDEHTGPTFRVRDVTSLSVSKASKVMGVEPKSGDAAPFSARNVVDAFRRVLGVFGRPYSILTVQVPYTLRPLAYIGIVCSVTSNRIPNVVTGGRGVSGVKGIVIGRQWDLSSPRGTLTVMISDTQLVGYTPTVTVGAADHEGGNLYAISPGIQDPNGLVNIVPTGYSIAGLYPVGTRVEMMEWDASSQTPQVGSVTAVDVDKIRVDFDSAPTFTGTRYLRYANATEITLETQTDWAYLSNTASTVSFGTGTETAREFSA